MTTTALHKAIQFFAGEFKMKRVIPFLMLVAMTCSIKAAFADVLPKSFFDKLGELFESAEMPSLDDFPHDQTLQAMTYNQSFPNNEMKMRLMVNRFGDDIVGFKKYAVVKSIKGDQKPAELQEDTSARFIKANLSPSYYNCGAEERFRKTVSNEKTILVFEEAITQEGCKSPPGTIIIRGYMQLSPARVASDDDLKAEAQDRADRRARCAAAKQACLEKCESRRRGGASLPQVNGCIYRCSLECSIGSGP